MEISDAKKRVLVGMSGGVDSSAVCMLLQEQGYEVYGVTLRIWDTAAQFNTPEQTEPNHVLEARELATRIGIEHIALDVRDDFRHTVVKNFIDEYRSGRTPNPCVMCNLFFKWRYLLQEADRLGCYWVATGHYARVAESDGRFFIQKGLDPTKDQSYFLWRLGQDQLARTIFPLGEQIKSEIKAYVTARGFKEKAVKKESMEVCFVEDDYRSFLRTHVPDIDQEVNGGYFVDAVGRKLGQHKGFPFYTIGQRKGLEIALGQPAYVIKINPLKNTIRLGDKEELLTKHMLVEQAVVSGPTMLDNTSLVSVRIRYRSAPILARVTRVDGDRLLVAFETEASAVTPGQSAVFYQDDTVVGGAIIADQRNLKKYLLE